MICMRKILWNIYEIISYVGIIVLACGSAIVLLLLRLFSRKKKNIMTLHIIGNGFDLAHGIASRYIDFKNYAWKHGDQYQMGLLETCYPDMNHQKKELELWCDLERALGNLNFQAAFDATTEDVELEEGHEGRYQAQMEDAPEYALEFMFDAFHKVFDDWVNHIGTDVEPLNKIKHFDVNGRFLSFNYTDTLEKVYDIPRKSINYIHGRRNSNDEIIVGHCSTVNANKHLTDDPIIYEYQGYENIAQKVNEQRKSVDEIVWKNKDYWKSLPNINKVVVYGHSLSEVDMAYFHEIANNVADDCEWYFSIHSNNLWGKAKALKHFFSTVKTLELKKLHSHTFMM